MGTPIDITALSARHTSDAAARRVRRRHRAEWRLKAYGIAAIALAAAALLTLLWTIAEKTVGVLYESYIVVEAPIELGKRDLAKVEDPNPQVKPSLSGPVREGLLALQGQELGRNELRQLVQLLSGDAGLELGAMVKQDPGLAGQTIRYRALLDDEIQMYLKGSLGELEPVGSDTAATPEQIDDETLRIALDGSALAEARRALAAARAAEAARARAEQARQQHAIDVTEERLAETEDADRRERLQERLDGYVEKRDAARAEAERLGALASDPASTFALSSDDPSVLIRIGGGWVQATELAPGQVIGRPLVPLASTGPAARGEWQGWLFPRPEASRNVTDLQIVWLEDFRARGLIETVPNTRLLSASDSSNPELAGIWGAVVGSFWTMMVTFAFAFPVGVLASIYLEEFAPKNRLTAVIEVNINNLAAVPSIVFGLLGLAIFVSGIEIPIFGREIQIGGFVPRSSPLAGGMVLALMTLPTIIIAGRASIRAVPPSVREAALGLGASRLQTATHHVLPLAMPGIMTGAIIGMAQALGETAPLLLVGMNSFIQEPPATPLDPANVLPTLIYQWNNNSERLFDDKTAAAIAVLLIFLVAMNALAVLLRKRFERRW